MKIPVIILILCVTTNLLAQQNSKVTFIHSHNDYKQKKPLFCALNANARSIEIDVFLYENKLMVAHSKSEIEKQNTLEALYLLPLKNYLSSTNEIREFHLMIDIKSEPVLTLNKIETVLKEYPMLFSDDGIQVIISGNRPNPKKYSNYSNFICFDGRDAADATKTGGKRVAMISQSLSKFTQWRGKGEIPEKDKKKLQSFIAQCHKHNKPVRLWNTGDNQKMYEFLYTLGVDYINTDKPEALNKFLNERLIN